MCSKLLEAGQTLVHSVTRCNSWVVNPTSGRSPAQSRHGHKAHLFLAVDRWSKAQEESGGGGQLTLWTDPTPPPESPAVPSQKGAKGSADITRGPREGAASSAEPRSPWIQKNQTTGKMPGAPARPPPYKESQSLPLGRTPVWLNLNLLYLQSPHFQISPFSKVLDGYEVWGALFNQIQSVGTNRRWNESWITAQNLCYGAQVRTAQNVFLHCTRKVQNQVSDFYLCHEKQFDYHNKKWLALRGCE